MSKLNDFIEYELYPALYERIDSAFPSMEFRRKGGDWHSSHKLNGEQTSPYREDKTIITKKYPNRAKEQGGESISLIDLCLLTTGHAKEANGAEFLEALRYLADICGLALPDNNAEEYKAYKEQQEQRERTLKKMQKALFAPEGSAVLDYLKNVRKYSEEEIKAMELGYCSEAIAKEMDGALEGFGSIFTLAIPYRSGNSIKGFKLRTLSKDHRPKYLNTKRLLKKASLFGLTGLKLTGNGAKDRDLTIVEGELDALRAQVRGVENVVAAAGLDISEEALEEAKRRGVKRITVLVDWEGTEEEQHTKDAKIEKAIHTIAKAGLRPLVAELPEGAEKGEKVDTDSFLNDHSAEELQQVIDGAATGAIYLFDRIRQKAVERQGDAEAMPEKVLQDYIDEACSLLNDSNVTSPTDKERILSYLEQSTTPNITKETLREEADARKRAADAAKQERLTKELIKKASDLASSGEVEGSLRLMAESAPALRKVAKEVEYSSLLNTPTATSIREKLRTRPEGIKTDYVFSKGGQSERLMLPAGALTLVAAGTSHGKSTFLRNLALQTAGNGQEGTVLYFSFEEDMESTVMEFVNTYAGLELTTKTSTYCNLTTIEEYYRTGSTQYIKNEAKAAFKKAEEAFMKDYIEAGKLRIYDNDFSSNELVDVINFIAKSLKVKAIFVDYVQLLYKEGNRLQRNEELKEIAKGLRQTAKGLKLPIILAAQLNRDAKSPTEMHSQNIADSADLEREANKILLLWSSEFLQTNDSKYEPTKIEEGKRPTLGKAGKIYAKLSKNRGGKPSIDALFDFNGNTGRIATNYEEDAEPEAQQGDLPFSAEW